MPVGGKDGSLLGAQRTEPEKPLASRSSSVDGGLDAALAQPAWASSRLISRRPP
jgi:hypothetical protein